MTFHDVATLAMGTDEAASIDLDFTAFSNQPEFHRIPEKAAEFFQNAGVLDACAHAAIVLQKIRKHGVCVHGHMAEDIVKDIGFRRVFERFPVPQPCRCWKQPRRQHLKKRRRRQESTYWSGGPARSRCEARTDGGKIRQAVSLQADDLKSVERSEEHTSE